MPDVELDAPEIDNVDRDAPAYKRVVALIVVLITLFGSIVAYLQAVESNDEDVAARDAQRDAVAGLGAQVDASADLAADLLLASEVDAVLQRQALNAARVANLEGDADSDIHVAAADRYAAVREAIAGFTPVDPQDQATVLAEIAVGNESPDAARLRQFVEADRANDHGGKADSYVAVLTVLAVALFLLGLSLTVQGRSRFVLAAPGVAVALVCVAWTALISRGEVTVVSERSVQAAARGQRLADAGDLDGAIDAFDLAIDDSPDFAAAYARRADVRFVEGSAQTGQTGFISITSDEALEAALEDTERALDLGAGTDVITVADAGFLFFLAEDFDRSVALSRQALELNDQLPQVWLNVGVAEIARGDEAAAARAYREGRQLLDDAVNAGIRSQVLAGARTDLSVLRELLTGDDLDDALELIEATEVELAAFEAGFVEVPCLDEPCPGADEVGSDASVGDVELTTNGPVVIASYPVSGVEPGTPLTNVWYVRTDEDLPFEQTAIGVETVRVGDDATVVTATLPSVSPSCPVPGDYLVRVYAGDRFVGEVEGTVEPGRTGTTFTSVVDPIEGFDACLPEGFTFDQADVTDIDSFTGFFGEEFDFALNVTPGSLAEGIDPDELNRAVLVAILGVDESDLVEITFRARSVDGSSISIPGLAGVSADGVQAIASAVGPDRSSRNISLFRDVDLDLLIELTGLVEFTGLPEP